jgi:uncharacterized membrane protein
MKKIIISFLLLLNILTPLQAQSEAQLEVSKTFSYKAEILEVKTISTSTKLEDDDKEYLFKILEGEKEGQIKSLTSKGYDYEVGDFVYLEHTIDEFSDYWNIGEILRYDILIYTSFFFLAIVLLLYGWKGVRALLSLSLSLLVICFILLPLTLKGYNPVFVASIVSILLLVITMIFTHGYNKVTLSAFFGCAVSVFITIIISYIIIVKAKFTGFHGEEATYLYYNTEGLINFKLLTISSFIIGVIGVVNDGAITQSGMVRELKKLNSNLNFFEYYKRAMKVGNEHAGTLINTLLLVYVSSALPLLLFLYTVDTPLHILLNKEIISVEIIKALVGCVGLLLSIPLSTLFACYMIKDRDIEADIHTSHGHSHAHSH